jgi:methylthioribulose-1-phosphate dehydratase
MADSLCQLGRLFGQRQWCLGTSGNFSARLDDSQFLITQSGKDKSVLTPDDLMICDLNGIPRNSALRPSAETALHLALYRHDPGISAVLHTHSVCATLLSRTADSSVAFSGYEMQKAMTGVGSHEDTSVLPVFDNTQDMRALADQLHAYLVAETGTTCGFLVRGHGLYAWGRSLAEARRHLEGLEFLLSCRWQEKLAGML